MTTYNLKFLPLALKEWKKLSKTIQTDFKKKLRERLTNPKVKSAKLSGFSDVYKIKLRTAGYRLIYQVIDGEITVLVIAVGKRDKSEIYKSMCSRIN